MSGVPLQRMVIPPEGFLSTFGRQMHGPAVALSRSIRTQQRCRPNLETACPHLADRSVFAIRALLIRAMHVRGCNGLCLRLRQVLHARLYGHT
jgi:hypothetical protein